MGDYTLEQGLGVRERMDLLAAVHGPATTAVLDRLGVAEGARCLDLGCGGGHVALELARRVGPTGQVVGIDLDEALLVIAREMAAAQGLDNVTFTSARADEVSDTGFDLAFSRFLLSHLRDRERVLAVMASAVRPNGRVLVEDTDWHGAFTHPRCPSYEQWIAWFREAVRLNGGDLDLGPTLPSLLRAVGLEEIGIEVTQRAELHGPYKELQQMSMGKTRAAILAAGVVEAGVYDRAHAELKAFTADSTTLMAAPRVVHAWGTRV
jgi:SAM-dependent methyltransferase